MKYWLLLILVLLCSCSNVGQPCAADSDCRGICNVPVIKEISHEEYPICLNETCMCGCRTASGDLCR